MRRRAEGDLIDVLAGGERRGEAVGVSSEYAFSKQRSTQTDALNKSMRYVPG